MQVGVDWGALPTMSSEGSITKLLHQLDPAALSVDQRRAQEAIWERFFGQLVVVARQKLGGAPRRVADGDGRAFLD